MKQTSSFRSKIRRGQPLSARVRCWLLFGLLLAACAVAYYRAVITTPVRTLFVVTIAAMLLFGFLRLRCLMGGTARALIVVAVLVALLAGWGAIAGRPPDRAKLRDTYVRRLRSLEGARYFWGGETGRRIDCSGLARVAFWQTMVEEGIRRGNPRLLGPMLWRFWWRDMSAKDMLNGSYGYTHVIGRAEKLSGCDTSRLLPGDLAVAESGVHVLIYVGGNRWIEASPDDQRVVTNEAYARNGRGWFNVKVTFVRWWVLDEQTRNKPHS